MSKENLMKIYNLFKELGLPINIEMGEDSYISIPFTFYDDEGKWKNACYLFEGYTSFQCDPVGADFIGEVDKNE